MLIERCISILSWLNPDMSLTCLAISSVKIRKVLKSTDTSKYMDINKTLEEFDNLNDIEKKAVFYELVMQNRYNARRAYFHENVKRVIKPRKIKPRRFRRNPQPLNF